MNTTDVTIRPTLWIIRWQDHLSKVLRSRIIASVLMFYVPALASGLVLQVSLGERVFTRGVHFALVWLAIAPFIIQDAFRLMLRFFEDHRSNFADAEDWQRLRSEEILRLYSSRYLIFGIPWTIVVVAIILCTIYLHSHVLIKLWATLVFSILFLLSSIGFNGIYANTAMLCKLCSSSIRFQPYHPDLYGGMAAVGTFALHIAVFFSTGCLLFPAAFEVLRHSFVIAESMTVVVCGVVAVFVGTMTLGFVLPVLAIKKFADAKKIELLLASRDRLVHCHTMILG